VESWSSSWLFWSVIAAQRETYVIVPDADAHYAQAKGAGATIVLDIVDASYGGRGYSCRDLEGHLWSFGTYNPWAERKEG